MSKAGATVADINKDEFFFFSKLQETKLLSKVIKFSLQKSFIVE